MMTRFSLPRDSARYNETSVFEGKPIIGLTGGIGSGKTFVAKMFGDEGCLVINSDEMVRHAYHDETVKHTLKQWWGKMVFEPNGEVDRSAIARKIFNMPSERTRLERLIHPIVNEHREHMMKAAAYDPAFRAYVWDTPLLLETQLSKHCDAVVFIDAPREVRLERLKGRGWDETELNRREKSQMPLDKKAEMADYSVVNPGGPEGADEVRRQVREVLSRILERVAAATEPR
jgi:dephospho-CoA kinase